MPRRPQFLGTFAATLDSEGRIQLPAALRDELHLTQPDFQLTASFEGDGSLALRDREEWERWSASLLNSRAALRQVDRRTLAAVAAHASPVKCDKQGRIRVPDVLLGTLGLDRARAEQREVVLTGAFHELRLWSRSGWEEFSASARASLGAGLDGLLLSTSQLETAAPDSGSGNDSP